MRKLHQLFRFPLLLGWMLLIVGVGMVMQHPVAHAAPFFPPGYSLTLTESTSTMSYGGTPPTFQAQLTVPAGENPLTNPAQFTFQIDTTSFAPDGHTSGGSTYTFTLNGSTVSNTLTLPAGQHQAAANYFSSVLNQTLTSAPVTLTVQKFTPAIGCNFLTAGLYTVNSPVTFEMAGPLNGGPPIDWQNATYSFTFVGPQTFTDSNLTASNLGQGTVLTPPVGGRYQFQCTFSGTSNFNAAQTPLSTSTLNVTQGHQAGIKLYSTPTTITGGTNATLDIIVSGGSGLPTPTGEVALFLGPYTSTNRISLSAGQVTVQIVFPSPLPSTTMQVYYYGDAVYAQSSATFSLTNPPIPGGSNPTPNPTSAPVSTAPSALTSTPSGSSTPAASTTPTFSRTPVSSGTTFANGGTTAGGHPPATTATQGLLVFGIVLAVLLLLAAGGSGAFIVLRNRTRAATSATTTLPLGEEG